MSCLPNLDKAILKHRKWESLSLNIRRIDLSLDGEPEAVPDRAKALFETVTKTILVRLGVPAAELERFDIEALKGRLIDALEIKEPDSKVIKNFTDILSSTRNQEGIIGHGRDIDRERDIREGVDSVRIYFIIGLLDACMCLLIERLEARSELKTEEDMNIDSYSTNEEYNESLDSEGEPVKIRGVIYKRSELLFYTDRVSYDEGLDAFQKEPNQQL